MTEIKIIRSKRKTLSLEVKENGEVVLRAPFWCSSKIIDDFVNEKNDWLKSALERQKKISENKVQLDDKRIAELKKSAKLLLPERVRYYSRIMGVEPTGVKITSAQKRFESCNTKNSICFSYLLMLYPQEAIDYVVVHELAHIRFHNHGKDFYSFIESVLPDYRNREKLLKDFLMN